MQGLVQIRFPIRPAHRAASGDSSHTTYRDASGRIQGSGDTRTQGGSGNGSSTQYRDASGRITGSSATSGRPSGSHTATRRDASGRMIGSSSGTGKCQDAAKVPVPPAGAKK